MSKQPLVDYYIKMKISNLSGKKVLLIPGDNDPASGMPINANVIAMISKDVPVVEPNVPAVQFAVVDAASRRQFLLINGSQLITLRPVKNKNVVPINLVIGNPSESTNCWGTLPFNFWSAPAMWKRTKNVLSRFLYVLVNAPCQLLRLLFTFCVQSQYFRRQFVN